MARERLPISGRLRLVAPEFDAGSPAVRIEPKVQRNEAFVSIERKGNR